MERAGPTEAPGSDFRQHQAALAHDVNDLRRQLEQLQATGAPAPDAAPTSEPDPYPELDGNEHAQAVAESVEQHLLEQAVDTEWAAGMQARFDELFANERLTGSHVGAVDCRSTLCRLEVSFDDLTGRDALVDAASSLLEPNAQGFAHIEDDEDLEIQVYLSRQDTVLPVEG